MANHPPPDPKDNPGALRGATGVDYKADSFKAEEYKRSPLKATWKRTDDRHKRVVRMLALALHLGDPDQWSGLAVVLFARLTEAERASLAFAVLRSLDPEPREQVFDAAHLGIATSPEPSPFDTPEWRATCAEHHARQRRTGWRRAAA